MQIALYLLYVTHVARRHKAAYFDVKTQKQEGGKHDILLDADATPKRYMHEEQNAT